MPENLKPRDPHFDDDELARFADRVIGGERPEVPDRMDENRELAETMQTVVRLERTLKADQPDPAMSHRIKANLLKEWERSGPAADQGSFWQRLWPDREGWSAAQQRQLAGLVVAIGVVALLLSAYPLIIAGGSILPGTGSGGGAGLPVSPAFVVGGLVVLAGALWWLSRPRR
jgi:anti-sigma-K factor RskA